jgi:uncharacterized protein (TIGR02594 family)
MAVSRRALATDPPWLRAAFDMLGTREIAGSKHNPKIVALFKDVGLRGITDDETAWCAVFVGSMLKKGGMPCLQSAAARSYLEWGKKTDSPKRGDVVIIKRGTGWQGHVFFFLGIEGGKIVGIGGNQSNSVSVSSFTLRDLLGYRTPVTLTNSRTIKASVTAGAGTASMVTGGVAQQAVTKVQDAATAFPHSEMAQQVTEVGSTLSMLASLSMWMLAVGSVFTVGGIVWVIYARYSDWKEKAR